MCGIKNAIFLIENFQHFPTLCRRKIANSSYETMDYGWHGWCTGQGCLKQGQRVVCLGLELAR